MNPMFNVALKAIKFGSNFLIKNYESNLNNKENDYVINVFIKKIEKIIIEIIYKFYPKHTIISRGYEIKGCNYDIKWIINPLDGLINFTKLFPYFSISIAIKIKNKTEISIIYDPIKNELFSAIRGQGSLMNGYRLRNNNRINKNNILLLGEFPIKNKYFIENYINILNKLYLKNIDIYKLGSNLLSLAYVASGRVDGYIDINFKKNYILPGELLIKESGKNIVNFSINNNNIKSKNIIVGNEKIINFLLSFL